LIDVGTGCGVLGLSTLIRHPDRFALAYLTEISSQALAIAQKNLTQYYDQIGQTSVTLLQSSLLDGVIDGRIQIDHHDDSQQIVIVANLPYIPDGTFDHDVEESVKSREPRMAFVGGNDGNDWYRKMFDQLLADPKV
jgi:methylase of polypeptide subunit release factors